MNNTRGKKLLNIIVPVYNTERLVGKCLDSILSQTYFNLRVICVDDGSTDKSPEILDEYKAKDPRIVVIHKENGGVGSARNAGLDYIDYNKQSYITFVDSDDRLGDGYFRTLIERMEYDGADAICSDFIIERDNGISNPTGLVGYPQDALITGFDATISVIKSEIIPTSFAKIYKSNILQYLRYDEKLFIGEDIEITYRNFFYTDKVSIIHYPEYYFNRVSWISSLTRQKWNNRHIISFYLCDLSRLQIHENSFSEKQNKEIMDLFLSDCADNFLQVYPRFQKRGSLPEHRNIYREYVHYINKNKIIKKFIPYNRKTKIKKVMYLYFRPFYRLFCKLFVLK